MAVFYIIFRLRIQLSVQNRDRQTGAVILLDVEGYFLLTVSIVTDRHTIITHLRLGGWTAVVNILISEIERQKQWIGNVLQRNKVSASLLRMLLADTTIAFPITVIRPVADCYDGSAAWLLHAIHVGHDGGTADVDEVFQIGHHASLLLFLAAFRFTSRTGW